MHELLEDLGERHLAGAELLGDAHACRRLGPLAGRGVLGAGDRRQLDASLRRGARDVVEDVDGSWRRRHSSVSNTSNERIPSCPSSIARIARVRTGSIGWFLLGALDRRP